VTWQSRTCTLLSALIRISALNTGILTVAWTDFYESEQDEWTYYIGYTGQKLSASKQFPIFLKTCVICTICSPARIHHTRLRITLTPISSNVEVGSYIILYNNLIVGHCKPADNADKSKIDRLHDIRSCTCAHLCLRMPIAWGCFVILIDVFRFTNCHGPVWGK
jgi:hypothetical protein